MLRNFRLMVVFSLLYPSLCLADFSGRVAVQVLADGKMQKVRLNGIDAPESRQPFGQRSKQNLLRIPVKVNADSGRT